MVDGEEVRPKMELEPIFWATAVDVSVFVINSLLIPFQSIVNANTVRDNSKCHSFLIQALRIQLRKTQFSLPFFPEHVREVMEGNKQNMISAEEDANGAEDEMEID